MVADNSTELEDVESESESKVEPLTAKEQRDLQRCESVIQTPKRGFEETCWAMHEIWSARLYRSQYKSFKAYCEEKWGFHRSYGCRLLQDHQTIQKVSTMVDTLVGITSGSQASELAKIPNDKLAEVVREAKKKSGTGKLTTQNIRKAAIEVNAHATPATAVQTEALKDSLAEVVAEAPAAPEPMPATPGTLGTPTPSPVALVDQYAPEGFHTFRQMNQLIEKIAEFVDVPSRRADLIAAITELKGVLSKYAQIENDRPAT